MSEINAVYHIIFSILMNFLYRYATLKQRNTIEASFTHNNWDFSAIESLPVGPDREAQDGDLVQPLAPFAQDQKKKKVCHIFQNQPWHTYRRVRVEGKCPFTQDLDITKTKLQETKYSGDVGERIVVHHCKLDILIHFPEEKILKNHFLPSLKLR